jgi:hypothetical protein
MAKSAKRRFASTGRKMNQHTPARRLVPQSIRDHFSIETKLDNVFFAARELDAKLFELYKEIQDGTGSTENIIIDNVLLHSDAYVYALKTLIRASKSHIRIFTRHLDQRMLDGTPLYSDPDLIDALKSFLGRTGAKLDIIFRQEPAYELFEDHLLLRTIGSSEGLNVYCATDPAIKGSHARFITFDDQKYNLRFRNYAIINFNNGSYVSKLVGVFDQILDLPTTFRLVAGTLQDEWGAAQRRFG